MAGLAEPVLRACGDRKGRMAIHFWPISRNNYHAVPKFDVITGEHSKSASNKPSYTSVFAETLTALAKKDRDIVAITAAMPSGTGLDKMAKTCPSQVFDAGIAEQHAVTFAAGLAAGDETLCSDLLYLSATRI